MQVGIAQSITVRSTHIILELLSTLVATPRLYQHRVAALHHSPHESRATPIFLEFLACSLTSHDCEMKYLPSLTSQDVFRSLSTSSSHSRQIYISIQWRQSKSNISRRLSLISLRLDKITPRPLLSPKPSHMQLQPSPQPSSSPTQHPHQQH